VVAQPDDGLKSRPKHVVVLTHCTKLQYNKKFVVFRLTYIAYCITLGHNGNVPH
jgi:hypothetical protein